MTAETLKFVWQEAELAKEPKVITSISVMDVEMFPCGLNKVTGDYQLSKK